MITVLTVVYPFVLKAMSNRLHDILSQEADKMAVIQNVSEERRKELKSEDDEEDYLDECKRKMYFYEWFLCFSSFSKLFTCMHHY